MSWTGAIALLIGFATMFYTQFRIVTLMHKFKQRHTEVTCQFEHVKMYTTFDVIKQTDDNPYVCLVDNTKFIPKDCEIVCSSWTASPQLKVQVHYTDFLWGEGLTSLHAHNIDTPTDVVVQYDVCFKSKDCTRLKMITVVNNYTILPNIVNTNS